MTTFKNARELFAYLGDDCPYRFGRTLYKHTDCGPATCFILADGDLVYYKDHKAFDNSITDLITGIRISSIVEGSDVEVGPVTLMFPFTEKDLDKTVRAINDEAVFYWNRDNTDNFWVTNTKTRHQVHVQWTQFDDKPKWHGKLPRKAKQAWITWYTRGRWHNGMAEIHYDQPLDFGYPGFTTTQFLDYSTYC